MRLSRSEGERRHAAIQDFLVAEDFIGYVVFTSENFVYTTHFWLDVQTWERPVAAIFPRGGQPSLILNELSTNHYEIVRENGSCWVPQAEIYVEHHRLINPTYTRPEWDRLFVDMLKRHGMTRGRVAVDSVQPISAAIRAMLPDVTFRSCPELIRDLRLVKSEEELDILRAGGKFTYFGMEQVKELLAPNEFIQEVCFEASRRIARYLGERHPEEHYQIRVACDTGVDTACPHSPSENSGRRISRGDSVITNVILRLNGYIIEDERTFIVGQPSDDQVHYMDAMTRAQQAAINALVEGNRIADVDAAAQRVHEQAGTSQYLFHRTGHGIGIGGHEYPDDMAYNYRPLQYGMVFSTEPAVFVRGLGGFRHSDTVIVGRETPEPVTSFSKRLEDLVIAV